LETRHAGIVRRARRPSGWVAPGPPPLPPGDDASLEPQAGEDLCYLSGDWRIFQRIDGHRWSLDDLITAWVARQACRTPPGNAVDLGCGIGSVLLMMAWSFPEARVVGIEAQALSVDLARRSLRWNGVEGRCEVRLGDLRDPTSLPAGARFDVVTGTPPYFPRGTGLESERVQWASCHFEHRGGVEAYCAAAARLLAADGCFVMCAAARDADRVSESAQRANLGVRRRLEVVPRDGKASLFNVYVMHHGRNGGAVVSEAPLVIRHASGQRTESYLRVRHDMGLPP